MEILLLYLTEAVFFILLALFFLKRLAISRSFQLFGNLVPRVETDNKVIALTFDDGPKPEFTEEILNILDAEGVKATFFLLGQDIAMYQEETRKIIAAGHEVGNHTYTHRRMILASNNRIAWEIEKTEKLIKEAGYEKKAVFRPPFGSKLLMLPRYLQRRGITTVTWDIEPETDIECLESPERIADYVYLHAKPGSIVLLHVMFESRKASMCSVTEIIRRLKADGYRFVSVSELISVGANGA